MARLGLFFTLFLNSLGLIGCHHQIAFENIEYTIESPKQDTGILVVIDQNTINQLVPIKSWMTGIAHSWEAKPGQMLKQVADVEFSQMFSSYEWTPVEKESSSDEGAFTLMGISKNQDIFVRARKPRAQNRSVWANT